ncbi:hypothetical protein [Sphingomonas sp. UYP23]
MKAFLTALLLAAPLSAVAPARATSIPPRFPSAGADRAAIQLLLDTYAKAVSSKDEALFETLLLNKSIPFSDVGSVVKAAGADPRTQHYDAFKKGVFGGLPFSQHFQGVHIQQDGALAAVSLVFVNRSASGSSWGWKTLQLLKIDGRWKIASEFYTGHPI